ncbi:MAG: hypothetical protein WKF75_13420 [Singulisphaera sp.]
MSWSRSLAGLVGVLFIGLAGSARGAGPAEVLFRLVPPDAGVTLAVEDLSGHTREFLASPLAERLGRLPAVRDWLDSDRSRRLRHARREVEAALGENLATIRDGLLGDAVVLALHLPPGGRPDEARGLLLVRVRDRGLLDRLIRDINAAQSKGGELLRVVERSRGRTPYSVREFRPGGRATEYYATLPDHLFAWSNSEESLRGVIDRKGGGAASLHDSPGSKECADGSPIARWPACSSTRASSGGWSRPCRARRTRRRSGPSRCWVATWAPSPTPGRRSSGATGSCCTSRSPSIRRSSIPGCGAGRLGRCRPPLRRAESRRTPWPCSRDTSTSGRSSTPCGPSSPTRETAKLDNLLEVARGIFLGLDLKSAVLPHLGPRLLAYVEPPDPAGGSLHFPVVASLDVGGEPGPKSVAAALENALRSVLAIYALAQEDGDAPLRVESHSFGGVTVTALGSSSPFAFAVGENRLVLATSAEAVARALVPASRSDSNQVARLDQFRRVLHRRRDLRMARLGRALRLAETYRGHLARTTRRGHPRPDDQRPGTSTRSSPS